MKTGLFTAQMQNQVQEETTEEQNSDMSPGGSSIILGKQVNRKERIPFLVNCECGKENSICLLMTSPSMYLCTVATLPVKLLFETLAFSSADP